MYNIITKLFCARLDGEQTNLLFSIYTKSVRKYTVGRLMALQAVEIMRWAHIAHLHRFFFFYETIAKTRSFVNRFWYTAATIKKKVYTMLLLLFLFFTYYVILLWVHFCCIGAIVAGSGTNAVRWLQFTILLYYYL